MGLIWCLIVPGVVAIGGIYSYSPVLELILTFKDPIDLKGLIISSCFMFCIHLQFFHYCILTCFYCNFELNGSYGHLITMGGCHLVVWWGRRGVGSLS